MLGRQVRMLLGEPLERDLGFAASTGRLLKGAKPLSVLRAHGIVELRPIGAQQAAEPSNGHPEIMQRLAVEAIVEPTFCRPRRRQALERQPPRSFLVAAKQEVVWQCAATSRLEVARDGRHLSACVFRLRSVRNRDDWCGVSSFASDGVAPA